VNKAELAQWFAGHRPHAAKVVAVLGDKEQTIALSNGAHRWMRAANTLSELQPDAVRVYDGMGRLLGQEYIDAPNGKKRGPNEDEPDAPTSLPVPLLKNTTDFATMVQAMTQSLTTVVAQVSASQAKAHERAFEQLSTVTKLMAERLAAVEQLTHEAFERRAQELDQREEAAESEKQSNEQLMGVLKILADKAGPELVQRALGAFMGPRPEMAEGGAVEGVTNGAPKS